MNRDLKSEIAQRLRIARENAGLTQSQAAKLISIHRPSLVEVEKCRRKISAEELVKIAQVYEVSPSWILGENQSDEHFSDKIRLAARSLGRIKDCDLDKVIGLIKSLPHK